MENLQTWWRSLATREQQLVASCAVVFIIGILYWGIWSPINNAHENAIRDHASASQTLSYVKQTANQIAGLKQSGGRQQASGSLSSIVNQSAGKYKLVISRMQPQGNSIQLWMDDVPFEALLNYLHNLVEEKGLTLESVDLAESDTVGFVRVRRIQLSR